MVGVTACLPVLLYGLISKICGSHSCSILSSACSIENSFAAISAILVISSILLSNPISRHLANVRLGFGLMTVPSCADSCSQCLLRMPGFLRLWISGRNGRNFSISLLISSATSKHPLTSYKSELYTSLTHSKSVAYFERFGALVNSFEVECDFLLQFFGVDIHE